MNIEPVLDGIAIQHLYLHPIWPDLSPEWKTIGSKPSLGFPPPCASGNLALRRTSPDGSGSRLRPSDFDALSTGTLRCGYERSADHISRRCIEGLVALPSAPKRALGIPAARSCSVTAVARTGMADGTRCRARAACPE